MRAPLARAPAGAAPGLAVPKAPALARPLVTGHAAAHTGPAPGGLRERRASHTAASTSQPGDACSQEALLALLRSTGQGHSGPGEVYLVGTGPGDPGLLTLRAVQVMQAADVVLYDRLVSPEILRLVNGAATMVYVGKNMGFHTRTQPEIHELLCRFAREGGRVLRLKGGDPFIFGRGGEEMQYLQQRGIKVHTVPGITAASGISAELGIPLTHRGLATSVAFVTGHSREGGEDALDETVTASADPHTTLVVYMGLTTLPGLVARLTAAGLPASTPAAAVERGTTLDQRSVYAPLDRLHEEVSRHGLKSPTLLVIGAVVALSPGWRMAAASGCSLQDGRSYNPQEFSSLLDQEDGSVSHLSEPV